MNEPNSRNPLVRLVYAVNATIGTLLVLRLVMRILGANPANAVVNWVYNVSEILVRPFFGILNTSLTAQLSQAHLEVPTLIALVAYSLVAWALVLVFSVLG